MAATFYVLSLDDRQRLRRDMFNHNLDIQHLTTKIWPMYLSNMQQSTSDDKMFSTADIHAQKPLVVMLGNNHPVNQLMVKRLFEKLDDGSTIMSKICYGIHLSKNKNIRIKF